MFILYALVIGLLAGLGAGGVPQRLGSVTFRFGGVMVVGLIVQIVLFSATVSDRIGDLGPPIYMASTALVLVAVACNWRSAGIPVVILGATSNLAAIVANGGYMPADPGALAAVGHVLGEAYSNSALFVNPALRPLTDIFALPRWLPFTNVFSIGDVLIGVGVVWFIVAAMRRTPTTSVQQAPAAVPAEPVVYLSGWLGGPTHGR